MLVAAGGDIQVYTLPAAKPLGSLVGHTDQITGILETKDPKTVLSCAMDGSSAYRANACDRRPLAEISRPSQFSSGT